MSASDAVRSGWSVYVGRLVKCLRRRDVTKLFEDYGPILRCDVKYNTEMAYAFIDFQYKKHAEDCIKYEDGREVNGHNIIVEWANGRKDRGDARRSDAKKLDVCFRCRGMGHMVRDCLEIGKLGRRGGGRRLRSPIHRSKSCI